MMRRYSPDLRGSRGIGPGELRQCLAQALAQDLAQDLALALAGEFLTGRSIHDYASTPMLRAAVERQCEIPDAVPVADRRDGCARPRSVAAMGLSAREETPR